MAWCGGPVADDIDGTKIGIFVLQVLMSFAFYNELSRLFS